MRRKNYRYYLVAGLVVFLLLPSSCAKKEVSRVLRQNLSSPAAVSNLEASREDDSVRILCDGCAKFRQFEEHTRRCGMGDGTQEDRRD